MTAAVTDGLVQFQFRRFKTPPGIGHTIFVGARAYVVLSLDLDAKTGWARPFNEEDNLRDPASPIQASRQTVRLSQT